jgi:hypothetical protein
VGRENHYVPQFYLRNFSADDKSIHLINLDRAKHIPCASIKNQCSKRGFHDFHPEAEGVLANIEGSAASVIRKVLEARSSLVAQGEDFDTLMLFVVLQRSRTMAAAIENDEFTDWVMKLRAAGDPKFDQIDFNKIRISDTYPAAGPIAAAIQVFPQVLDLKCHLFVNETNEEFITSDNPVIIHNQFAETVSDIGVDGWDCRGIQAIVPLSPWALLFIYDADVYDVVNAPKGHTNISKSDVICLNRFQTLNATNNVYFKSPHMAQIVITRTSQLVELRKLPRIRFVRTNPVKREDGNYSELVSHYRPLLPNNLHLDPVHIQKAWRKIPDRERAPLWRHYPYRPFIPQPGDRTIDYTVRSNGPKDWSPPPAKEGL